MALQKCPDCGSELSEKFPLCTSCGYDSRPKLSEKSDIIAVALCFLFGPIGLWYKGHWLAGFVWLIAAVIAGVTFGVFSTPFIFVGILIHTVIVKPKK